MLHRLKKSLFPVKKLAVKILEYCLADNDKNCWENSKKQYDACSYKVIKSHLDDPKRIQAMKEKEAELKKKSNPKP